MTTASRPTQEQLLSDVLAILDDKIRTLDGAFDGQITEETHILRDLDFESVAIVEFCMAVGKHFRQKLPFQQLVFSDGKFQDFSVGDLVGFLDAHLPS